ncbi:Kinesin-related protein 4 [Hondaea fermentalgiana]|uniref:Kinesin-related protein 4 n=1 Tax=Hondaea fermentalgiana TaxID=2315210 RepID=A0A2R5GB69_9STRA|nr:Kinesin-related protein 4 [Hondaea fermentalgiana]|eukprot:GBG25803.1 Kinesin-related protein 4 [Hondaea fermentalgiana]
MMPRSPPLYPETALATPGGKKTRKEQAQSETAEELDRVLVGVRVRPLLPSELGKSDKESWAWDEQQVFSKDIDYKQLNDAEVARLPDGRKSKFAFDRVFAPDEQTVDVYTDQVAGLVERVVEGYNATILAYGQTTSGKTHTITGSDDEKGILQLALEDLFDLIRKDGFDAAYRFSVNVSYCEIYQEVVRDLLDPAKHHLSIADDPQRGPLVRGLTEVTVSTAQEALDLVSKGQETRKVGVTQISASSSRSHSIFQVRVESRPRLDDAVNESHDNGVPDAEPLETPASSAPASSANDALRKWAHSYERPLAVSTLSVIDLAGSERVSKTQARGERLKEAGFINKSLAALGNVIAAINAGSSHIPFRSCKLTRLLTSALGGNSYTAMICCVTPSILHHDESRSTLQFAHRASKIKTHAKLNQVETGDKILEAFRTQVGTLQRELALNVSEKQLLQEKVQSLERKLHSNLAKSLQTPRFARRKSLVPQTAVRPRRNPVFAAVPDAPFTVARLQQRGDAPQHSVRFQTSFESAEDGDPFVGAVNSLAIRSEDVDALEHELVQRDRQVTAAKSLLLEAQEKLREFLHNAPASPETRDEDEVIRLQNQVQNERARADQQEEQALARIRALEKQLENLEVAATQGAQSALDAQKAQSRLGEAQTRIQVLERQLQVFKEARPEQDDVIADLRAELESSRRRADAQESRAEAQEKRAEALERDLADCNTRIEHSQVSAQRLLVSAQHLDQEASDPLNAPLDQQSADSLENALGILQTKLERADTARAQRDQALAHANEQVTQLESQLEKATSELEQAATRANKIEEDASAEQARLIAEHTQERTTWQTQLRLLEDRATEQEALRQNAASLQEDLKGLCATVNSVKEENGRIRQVAETEKADLASRLEELETALEARNAQLAELDDARAALALSVEAKDNEVDVIKKTSEERYQFAENELHQLQDAIRAHEARERDYAERNSLLENRVADLEEVQQEHASLSSELSALKKSLQATKQDLEAAESRCEELEDDRTHLQNRVRDLEAEAEASASTMRGLEENEHDIEAAKKALVDAEEKMTELIDVKDQLETQVKDLNESVLELEARLKDQSEIEDRCSELEARVHFLQPKAQELETSKEKCKELETKIGALENFNRDLSAQVKALEPSTRALETSEQRCKDLDAKVAALEDKLHEFESTHRDLDAAVASCEELRSHNDKLSERVVDLEASLETKNATNLELLRRNEIASGENDARTLQLCKELEDARKECESLRSKLLETETARDELVTKATGLEASFAEANVKLANLEELQGRIAASEDALSAAEERRDAAEKELAKVREAASSAEALAQARASEVSASLQDAEQARTALHQLESDLAAAKDQLRAATKATAKITTQREESRALQVRVEALEYELESTSRGGQDHLLKADKRAEQLSRDYASLTEALDEARSALRRQRRERERHRRALGRSRRQVSLGVFVAMMHRNACRAHRSALDRSARAQEAAIKRYEVRLEAAEAQSTRHAAECKKLTGILQRSEHGATSAPQLQEALAQLQSALQARDKEIVRLKAGNARAETSRDGAEGRHQDLATQLERVDAERAAALEKARQLESALRGAKTEGLQDAQAARQEADVAALAICRALDRLEGLGAASPHLGAVELSARLDRATVGSKNEFDQDHAAETQALRVSCEQLERRVHELEAENQMLRKQSRQSASALATARASAKTLSGGGTSIHKLESKLDKLERLLREKDAQVGEYQQETTEVSKLLAAREEEVKTAKSAARAAREAEAQARADHAQLQARLQALEANIHARRPVSRELSELRLKYERAEQDCKTLAQENRALKEELRASEDLAQQGLASLQEESKDPATEPMRSPCAIGEEFTPRMGDGEDPEETHESSFAAVAAQFANKSAQSPFQAFQTPIPRRRGDLTVTPSTAVSRTSTSLIEELRRSASKQIDALKAGNHDLRLAFAEKDRQLSLVLGLMEESESDFRHLLDLLERFNHNSEDYAGQLAQVKAHMERLLTWQNRKREQRRRARQKQILPQRDASSPCSPTQ